MERIVNNNGESRFLGGKASRLKELKSVFAILSEFIYGFRKLHFVGPCITVFGSARLNEDNLFYKKAREFGKQIAQESFTVMTGGGPGIMEAANRGAKDIFGNSIGCNIELPKEQQPNQYLDLNITMNHFYVRKVLLLKYSYAFVVFPGGFGTLDELFETLALMQTKKISNFPLILFGKDYWTGLLEQMAVMVKFKTISNNDLDLLLVTDSIEEGMNYILDKLKEKYGVEFKPKKTRNKWWLGEKSLK